MKLCLLRGFVTVVKLVFASEDIGTKDRTQGSAQGSPCSFERFLWEWKCWVLFRMKSPLLKGGPRYEECLGGIVFQDRRAFRYFNIWVRSLFLSSDQKSTNIY